MARSQQRLPGRHNDADDSDHRQCSDGSLIFLGFVDPSATYTSLTFRNTSPGADVFGFEDLVIGDRLQVVLEPSTGLMLLAGLRYREVREMTSKRT